MSSSHTVVVGGNFFVRGSFSPIEAPTHFKVTPAYETSESYNENNHSRNITY